MNKPPRRGGFLIGLVVGLLVGLVLSLGVALYVAKVPVPFINKVPQRSAEQDAAEAERNKTWDPNAGLASKPAARASAPAGPAAALPPAAPTATGATATTAPATAAAPAKAASAAKAPAVAPAFYAQAGAYTRADDAEAQRAKLALLGLDAKVSEREQAGRTVYRVRAGPFETRAQVEAVIERLQGAGVEAALVRVERQ
jgi:cell division protein FtsN